MKTKEEEFVDKLMIDYPYIAAYYGSAQDYIFLCETLKKYGDERYNEGVEDAVKTGILNFKESNNGNQ